MSFWDNLWGSGGSDYTDYGSFSGPEFIPTPSQIPTPTTPSNSDSFLTPDFYSGLINAGAGLAGTYYTLSANKEQNEAQLKAAKERLDAEMAARKGGGGGGGGGGSGMAIAKMNNLANLYQNWGALRQKGAENEAQAAQATGKLGMDPIIARLAALR